MIQRMSNSINEDLINIYMDKQKNILEQLNDTLIGNIIIMIHEINETVLKKLSILKEICIKKNLHPILTFDDGLYSQFFYFDDIEKLFPTNYKIFFISMNIIHNNSINQIKDISCSEAHEGFFNYSNTEPYMNIDQINHLKNRLSSNVFIGGHGFNHISAKFDNSFRKRLLPHNSIKFKEFYNNWKIDYDLMIDTYNRLFKEDLKFYCWPYNEDNKIFKFSKDVIIFGKERLDIMEIRDE